MRRCNKSKLGLSKPVEPQVGFELGEACDGDSNPDTMVQSHVPYRWTISQRLWSGKYRSASKGVKAAGTPVLAGDSHSRAW